MKSLFKNTINLLNLDMFITQLQIIFGDINLK